MLCEGVLSVHVWVHVCQVNVIMRRGVLCACVGGR